MAKKNMLVVEDSVYIQENYKDLFKKDFNVFIVDNLEDALLNIQKKKWDVVITDGRFPAVHNGKVDDESDSIGGFRGDIAAAAAKARKIFVVGVSDTPKMFTKCDLTCDKMDLSDLKVLLPKELEKFQKKNR